VNRRSSRWVVGGTIALVLVGGGAAFAVATAGGDDRPLTGSTLERAAQAALEHTGGGTVVETEIGDDGAAYGVEVRLPDGGIVEVALDERFTVIGQESDDDGRTDPEDGSLDD
jgi:hypothetical protein